MKVMVSVFIITTSITSSTSKLDINLIHKICNYSPSQGLIALTLAVCLVSASAQPIFLLDPITASSFTTAGGLVLTAASGGALTIPTSTLVLGKAAAAKLLLLKALAAARDNQ